MTSLYLSRATLRRDAPLAALASLLVPDASGGPRTAAAHKLIWTLFADGPDRRRDFLWREQAPGRLLALSSRPPADPHGLFRLETKPFEPVLRPGDRLRFSLRANPVVARSEGKGQRGKRHDVVMDAIRTMPSGQRADARRTAILEAGRAWLERQGRNGGFSIKPEEISVDGYDRITIPRRSGPPAVFGVMDIDGLLTVEDPARFLAALTHGFGHARAFGCGLMLIRRAR